MDPNIRNVMNIRNIMNQEFREQFGVLPLADSSFPTQRRMLSEPRGQDFFGSHKDFRELFGRAGTGLLMEHSQNKVRSPTMGHLDPQFGQTSHYTNQRVSSLMPLADSCLTPTQRRMLSDPIAPLYRQNPGQDLLGRHKDFRQQYGLMPQADSCLTPTQRRMLSEPRASSYLNNPGQDLFGRHKDLIEQFGLQDSLTGSTNQRVSGTGTGLVMERSQNKVRSPTMGQLDPPFGRTSQDSSTGSTNQRVSGVGTGLLMERSQNKVRSPTMGHLDPPFGLTSQDSSTGSTNQRVSSLPLASSGKDFFLKHKLALEQRLPSLNPILSKFQERKVLNDQEREEVMSKSTSAERNLLLLTMIQNKGAKAQQVFYEVLKEAQPYLVEDLEG